MKLYKTLLLVLLSLQSVFAFPDKGKFRKTKTISKEFKVKADNTLVINNEYGDINITTWDKNEVSIVVSITADSNEKDLVEKKLEGITVSFSQEGNYVHATTHIKSKSGDNWSLISLLWNGNNNKHIDFSIDYEVKLPLTNSVDLTNDYGNIYIDKLEGNCKINCDYGLIRLGELHGEKNKINLDYASSSSIDFIQKGRIMADYSKLTIEEAVDLSINADYSNIDVENVKDLTYNSDYGSLELGKVQNLKGDGDYIGIKIDELYVSADIDCSYGSFRVYKLFRDFDSINVDAPYSSVKIGIEEEADFNFDLSNSYAGIQLIGLQSTFTSRIDKMSSKRYQGYVGKESTTSKIHISSEFGSIKLYNKD